MESVAERLERLKRRARRLEVLREVSLELNSERDLQRLLLLIMDRVTETLRAERSSLYLVEAGSGGGFFLVTKVAQKAEEIRVPLDKTSIAGTVAATGEIINLRDAYEDPRFNPEFDQRHSFRTRSMLTVPMKNPRGEIIGVTQVINKKQGEVFDQEDEEILLALSAQAAIAVENARYLDLQKQTFEGLIQGQAIAVDARDRLTSGHSWRVTAYSVEIARQMGLPEVQLEVIRYAGLLHDNGKLGVPDSILQKPGGLTDDEFAMIKSHAKKTRLILDAIRDQFPRNLKSIPDIASCHHEKLDGTGYPQGLKGDQVPLGARILAVADIFDALTAERHYRKPMPDDRVIEILMQEVEEGKLDGRVVEAMVEALPRIREARVRINREQQEAEKHGGLAGISHLRVIEPEWEKELISWKGEGKPPA